MLTALVSSAGGQAVTTVRLNDGSMMELDPRSRTEAGAFWCGVHEEDYRKVLVDLCHSYGSSFYDVGANVGLVVVPVARKLSTPAHVVAFEPVESNAVRLRRNLDHNGLTDAIVFECALGEASGVLTIAREAAHGATSGNAVVVASPKDSEAGAVEVTEVPVRTLDDIVQTEQLTLPDVIKVDVEGSEVGFLAGAQETLHSARPVVLGEFNSGYMPRFGTTFLDAVPLLPPDYVILAFRSGTSVAEELPRVGLGDVLLVPREKLTQLPLTVLGSRN